MVNHTIQNPALYSAVMKVLRERFGALAIEEFIVDVRSDSFDYTEWRKTQLWYNDMTLEEYLNTAAETTKNYEPPKGVDIL